MVQVPAYKIIFESKFVVFNKMLLTVSNKSQPISPTNPFSHRVVRVVRSLIDIFSPLGKVLLVLDRVVYNLLTLLATKFTSISLVLRVGSTP